MAYNGRHQEAYELGAFLGRVLGSIIGFIFDIVRWIFGVLYKILHKGTGRMSNKIGNGLMANSFQEAVKNAKSGDTLEFEDNYCETDGYTQITIDKNLHIKGNISKDAQGNIVFHNMVNCNIFVTNGAHVTIENLCLFSYYSETNLVNVQKNSDVELINVGIQNRQSSGEEYPVVYISDNSKLEMKNVTSYRNEKYNFRIYSEKGSSLSLDGCDLQDTGLIVEGTVLNVSNTNITVNRMNAIYVNDESEVTLKNNHIENSSEKLFSAVAVECSMLNDSGSVIVSESAIFVEDSSKVVLEGTGIFGAVNVINSNYCSRNSVITSHQEIETGFSADNSVVSFENDELLLIQLDNGSHAVIHDTVVNWCVVISKSDLTFDDKLSVLGNNPDYVNVYVCDQSKLEGGILQLDGNSIVRLESGSEITVGGIECRNVNVPEPEINQDKSSILTVGRQVVQ